MSNKSLLINLGRGFPMFRTGSVENVEDDPADKNVDAIVSGFFASRETEGFTYTSLYLRENDLLDYFNNIDTLNDEYDQLTSDLEVIDGIRYLVISGSTLV